MTTFIILNVRPFGTSISVCHVIVSPYLTFNARAIFLLLHTGRIDLWQLYRRLISGSLGGECEVHSFCDVAPCSLVEIDRRFRGACCL
jgi:hypothetical protein